MPLGNLPSFSPRGFTCGYRAAPKISVGEATRRCVGHYHVALPQLALVHRLNVSIEEHHVGQPNARRIQFVPIPQARTINPKPHAGIPICIAVNNAGARLEECGQYDGGGE